MRDFVIGLGLVLLFLAVTLYWLGAPGQAIFMAAFFGIALSLGTVFERRYKRPGAGSHGLGWTDTGERFIDPETGRRVAVYMSVTGEREYRTIPDPL